MDLIISKGRNNEPLPDRIGTQVAGAARQLNAMGFETSIVIPSYLEGQETSLYVMNMDPSPGTSGIGGVVTLYAATYQEVFPSPTPVPTTAEATEAQTEAPSESEEETPPDDGESGDGENGG